MKNLLFVLLLGTLATLSSCDIDTRQINQNTASRGTQNLIYTKDKITGLCFATYVAAGRYGLTCVPCDSLNKVPVKEVYHYYTK